MRLAFMHKKTEIFKLLVAKGANIHGENDDILEQVSNNGDIEMAKILLDAGADPHGPNDQALMYAYRNLDWPMVKLLREYMLRNYHKNELKF
jgi:ankyrin repeat protein